MIKSNESEEWPVNFIRVIPGRSYRPSEYDKYYNGLGGGVWLAMLRL